MIAVIQALNKVERGIAANKDDDTLVDPSKGGFTSADVQVLKALATHISVNLQNMREEENELGLRDTMRMLKDHGAAALLEDSPSTTPGRRPLFAD